ncbi:hypothetical protein M0R45_005473 [Rubus argutus]|uniref:J domain-containing protein n=1 Tax=Rubus argutus TaxID=59490 RepID=A0AAW1YMX6_RUBAR
MYIWQEMDHVPIEKFLVSLQQVLLKTEDVKKAFHLSALKWHPDKHQGPSQEMAAEKFKLCVNAYSSLCNALSAA